jgi:hypothetical protein
MFHFSVFAVAPKSDRHVFVWVLWSDRNSEGVLRKVCIFLLCRVLFQEVSYSCYWAMPWLGCFIASLSLHMPGFSSRPAQVWFVVCTLALRHVFLWVFQISPCQYKSRNCPFLLVLSMTRYECNLSHHMMSLKDTHTHTHTPSVVSFSLCEEFVTSAPVLRTCAVKWSETQSLALFLCL